MLDTGRRLVTLRPFVKKVQKTPRAEIELAESMERKQGNQAIPFSKVREKLMADPEFRKEYDTLGDEFALISQAIAARSRARNTQALFCDLGWDTDWGRIFGKKKRLGYSPNR